MDGQSTNKFGMVNLLTPEEKASYRAFAQKVHSMDPKDLIKLNGNMADELTSEQQDIVSWEMKIRELEVFKRNNIDPKKDFSYQNKMPNVQYADDPVSMGARMEERRQLSEMTDNLLEQSKKILDEHPHEIEIGKLHSRDGGGVNVLAKKYVVIDDDGNKITVNNQHIQDHFRKMYVKRMSEITGINYIDYFEGLDDIDVSESMNGPDLSQDSVSKINGYETSANDAVNLNDYEDD